MTHFVKTIRSFCVAAGLLALLGCAPAADNLDKIGTVQDIAPGEKSMISQPPKAVAEPTVSEKNI